MVFEHIPRIARNVGLHFRLLFMRLSANARGIGRDSLTAEDTEEHRERVEGSIPLRSSVSSAVKHCLPKITDFGLAQPIEGGKSLTQSGILVGTPGYMAPEEVRGKRSLAGPATDIYALGVVLHELSTGQRPFQRESSLEAFRTAPNRLNRAG
jgi:serine/threonine protein kinase